MSNGNGEHWLVQGIRGVNLATVIVLLLGGAKLYFDVDKELALMKRDMAQMSRTLSSIQEHLRRSEAPLYSFPPMTRSIKPEGKSCASLRGSAWAGRSPHRSRL